MLGTVHRMLFRIMTIGTKHTPKDNRMQRVLDGRAREVLKKIIADGPVMVDDRGSGPTPPRAQPSSVQSQGAAGLCG